MNMPPLQGTTTTSRLTCTSMAGARAFTSVAMPTESLSTRPLLATSTTSHIRWV
jgi:hypothetical protein